MKNFKYNQNAPEQKKCCSFSGYSNWYYWVMFLMSVFLYYSAFRVEWESCDFCNVCDICHFPFRNWEWTTFLSLPQPTCPSPFTLYTFHIPYVDLYGMDGPEEPLYFPSLESGLESDGLNNIKDINQKPCLKEKTVSRTGISSDSDKEGTFLIQTDILPRFHVVSSRWHTICQSRCHCPPGM